MCKCVRLDSSPARFVCKSTNRVPSRMWRVGTQLLMHSRLQEPAGLLRSPIRFVSSGVEHGGERAMGRWSGEVASGPSMARSACWLCPALDEQVSGRSTAHTADEIAQTLVNNGVAV